MSASGQGIVVSDAHAHFLPPEAAEICGISLGLERETGREVIELRGRRLTAVIRDFFRAEKVLDNFDRWGGGRAALSPWVGLLGYDLPAAEALERSRRINEALAQLAVKYPERVVALGTVPMQEPDLAAEELVRLARLGLRGVMVGPSVRGVYLGDERFRPFWAMCQALGLVVFIHPMDIGRPELRPYHLSNLFGNPVETGLCAAYLIFSGVMDAYPNLKVLLAHGGGVLPWLRGRFNRGFHVRPETRGKLEKAPGEYLADFYYDTVTHDPTILRFLVELVGPERVVLGSDYPFDMGDDSPVETVKQAGLGVETERLILAENFERLFGPAPGPA